MVPDSDKKVSHLIKITEQTPVSWNKSGVWGQVSEQIQPRASRRWYYYAAAVLLLGLLYAYVAPLKQGGPISSGKLEQMRTPTQTPPPKEQADTTEGKGTSNKTKPPILQDHDSMKIQSPLALSVSVSTPEKNEPEEQPPAIAFEMQPILPFEYTLEAQEENTVRKEKIEAVVGILYATEREETATKRKRGKKFYKLTPPDFRIRDDQSITTVVIARKK